MIRPFDVLTGLESLPSTVNVDGRDYSIITDYREWCKLDSYLFDTRVAEEMRGAFILHFFYPAIAAGEFSIENGAYPFSADDALLALIPFWTCGRETKDKGGGGPQSQERAYDYLHDAALIYAAFRQTYNIDLSSAGAMHWWIFSALFSALPEGSVFASAKSARLTKPEDYPDKARASHLALKEAWALPDHIRYYHSGGKRMTESDIIAHYQRRRAEALKKA